MKKIFVALYCLFVSGPAFADGHIGISFPDGRTMNIEATPADMAMEAGRQQEKWTAFIAEQGGILLSLPKDHLLLEGTFS